VARKKVKAEAWRDDALEAVRTLRSGGVVLHASDTVWGLACDATNPDAVAKLNAIKRREENTPILVLVGDDGLTQKIIEDVPEAAWELFDCSDTPTTIVMPNGKEVASSVTADNGSLAVRRVDDPWCSFVCRGLNRPIASTSANLRGVPTPKRFDSIDLSIVVAVDFVSSHRKSEELSASPSFMVEFDSEGRFKILRK
jgi:L-threonylcarbamoyladenylate synthase